jgi:hypothetical protein
MHDFAQGMAIAVMGMAVATAMVGIDAAIHIHAAKVVVIHRAENAEHPVNADRDQQDGQRQHGCADGEVPDFLHDAIIADKPTGMRDYKTDYGFEAVPELDNLGL